MNAKKYVISAVVVATILSGASSFVMAHDDDRDDHVIKVKASKEMAVKAGTEMLLNINHQGKVLMRGTVGAVGTGSVTVNSWGGDWTVNILADTKLSPKDTVFKVGDFAGILGDVSLENVSAGNARVINASLIRNWSARKEEQSMKKEVKEMMKAEAPRNWEGTASGFNSSTNSFTLTVDGTAYTVNVTSGAKIVNQRFGGIVFSDIKEGDKVRVWGPVSGTTITASVVRDVSIK